MENAKEIISESLPIKCLEAVILALYLTAPLTNLHRFTVGFKSNFNGLYYRHVVLGVADNTSYGALGLSRRQDLMYKALQYKVRLLLFMATLLFVYFSHLQTSSLTLLTLTENVSIQFVFWLTWMKFICRSPHGG